MRIWPRICLSALVASLSPCACPAAAAPEANPVATTLATGVWLIPEVAVPDRQPDGNSVVYAVPEGLVVVDTGRHAWHRDAILALARQRHESVAAIVNSHWHLDHVSGNPAMRAAFPRLRVYASDAIDRALDGFLAASAREAAAFVDDPTIPPAMRADIRADLLTTERGAALKPDIVIKSSGSMMIGGHPFIVNLAPFAVTSGDVWLFDEASGVAALGDLVTLPVPYLDTACPEGWTSALAQVAATPFRIAVPGHGRPMTPAPVTIYRGALESFLACAESPRAGEECAEQWGQDIEPLVNRESGDGRRATQGARYYVGLLRAGGGRSRHCEAT